MSTRKSKENDGSNASFAATFVALLDNDEIVTKLSQVLSTSFQLILEESLRPMNKKLDAIINDNKIIKDRITAVENENEKLTQQYNVYTKEIKTLKCKLNNLEQTGRRNNIIINGVSETYAERAADTVDEVNVGTAPTESRNDTIASVCNVVKEACKIPIEPSDINFAYRLKTKRDGPRPILVSFHSSAKRQSVMKARPPRQTLEFRGSSIYINDHLTDINAELSFKSRDLVKKHEAFSTWTNDGRIFIKWTERDRPTLVLSLDDLST